MPTQIHPSAVISPKSVLGEDVTIGPFCIVEEGVVLGNRCQLESHVVIKAGTMLGHDNHVFEASVLGGTPQHLDCGDEQGILKIGSGNTIREYVTIHRGLSAGANTEIGDNNLFMVNSHVAHDCVIKNKVIVANNVMLAGHVEVADHAYLSGAVGIHQFCRVGKFAMVGGQARITQDVPPFVMVDGNSSQIVGLNRVGLRRNGFSRPEIANLKEAYRIVFRSGMRWQEALDALAERFTDGYPAELHQFMAETTRGCIRERSVPKSATLKLFGDSDESRRIAS